MARIGQQTELAMEEDDGISSREEILGTGSTTSASGKVLILVWLAGIIRLIDGADLLINWWKSREKKNVRQ